jgi:hypothetical protein
MRTGKHGRIGSRRGVVKKKKKPPQQRQESNEVSLERKSTSTRIVLASLAWWSTPQNVGNLLPRQVVVPGSLALVALASLTHLTASIPARETGSRPAHKLPPYYPFFAHRRQTHLYLRPKQGEGAAFPTLRLWVSVSTSTPFGEYGRERACDCELLPLHYSTFCGVCSAGQQLLLLLSSGDQQQVALIEKWQQAAGQPGLMRHNVTNSRQLLVQAAAIINLTSSWKGYVRTCSIFFPPGSPEMTSRRTFLHCLHAATSKGVYE